MSDEGSGDIRHVREFMQELLQGEGMTDLQTLLNIKERWDDIAGQDLAALAVPYRLESGTLFLGVGSHARVQDTLFRAEEIKGGIKRVLNVRIDRVSVKKVNMK